MRDTSRSPVPPKLVRTVLYLVAFIFAAAGGIQAFQDHIEGASVLLIAACVAFLLTALDKISYIKAPGFEAKMQTLDAKMAEAHEIVSQLRALAVSTARHIITLVSCGDGYVEAYSKRTAWGMVENVRRGLVDLDIPQAKIDELLAPYHQQVVSRFADSFRRLVSDGARLLVIMHPALTRAAELSEKLNENSNAATDPAEWRRIAQMPSQFKREVPNDTAVDQREMLELVEDLEFWQTTRQLRRPEVYFG